MCQPISLPSETMSDRARPAAAVSYDAAVATSRPLRIFFASAADVLVAGDGNGEGIIATALIERLLARGHQITACVGVDKFGERPGLTIQELDRPRDVQTIQPLLRARRALQAFESHGGAESFDVVHALFPNWAPGVDARAYAPLPFVLGPVTLDWEATPRLWPIGFALRRVLTPWLMRRRRRTISSAAVLVTVGPWVRPEAGATKVIDLPFGIRPSEFPCERLPSLGFVALYVGRYDEARGVVDLALAARTVATEIPGFRMIFVGAGPMRDQLCEIAADPSACGAIEVRERVHHEEVAPLLSKSSVFCMPSRGEPFGMAVVEAMSAGRAIIAANSESLAWLVVDGAGGRLVPPGDVGALADAIRELARDRETLVRMGAFNRRRVEDQLDLDVLVSRWEAVYHSAINPSDGRQASS